MTQNDDTIEVTPAPAVGTLINLDDREWEVAEPTDDWTSWYVKSRGFRNPVYLVARDGEGEWTVEGAAYVAQYGEQVHP